MTREEAIRHFEYGISRDIFSEPVTSYARMAIAALKEQASNESQRVSNTSNTLDGWICVKTRKPRDGQKVLVHTQRGSCCVAGYSEMFDAFRGPGAIVVTHWMPLPEAPKEE